MKKNFLVVIMLLVSIVSMAQKLSSDKIVGLWQSEEYKIEIFKSGNTFSGKLLWAKNNMFDADGKTSKKDDQNPNEKLRNRNRQGITHITNLKFKEGEYIDGDLYSVENGNTYSIKGELKNNNTLKTRVYLGVPIMGKSVTWKRVQ